MQNNTLHKLGGKTKKARIVIDINKHGIRREINLDALYQKSLKRKAWENKKRNG